jgi:hypothetical protein
MNYSSKIMSLTALACALALNAGALQAAGASSLLTMKPLHGVSFDIGASRAVSYFLSDNGQCKLVLTLAEAPDWDNPSHFAATRFEATISAGNATHFNPTQGNAVEFACASDAQAMTATITQQVAAAEAQ